MDKARRISEKTIVYKSPAQTTEKRRVIKLTPEKLALVNRIKSNREKIARGWEKLGISVDVVELIREVREGKR